MSNLFQSGNEAHGITTHTTADKTDRQTDIEDISYTLYSVKTIDCIFLKNRLRNWILYSVSWQRFPPEREIESENNTADKARVTARWQHMFLYVSVVDIITDRFAVVYAVPAYMHSCMLILPTYTVSPALRKHAAVRRKLLNAFIRPEGRTDNKTSTK